jgi:hypothetical protein
MIVDNFHVPGIASGPDEAHPPLIDPDRVLSGPIPLQRLEAIASKLAKIT